jgi:hypothetical protein
MKIPFWSDVLDARQRVHSICISRAPQENYVHAVQEYRFLFWRAVSFSFVWIIVFCLISILVIARFL